LIEFYRENIALWNHHLVDYRDRNFREVLLDKLANELEGKFTIADIKQQWHNLVTTYKLEKQREDCSKSSGSGVSDVYSSNWDFFNSMCFIDVTCDIDKSQTSLDSPASLVPPSKKKKLSVKEDEQSAKTQLWKALATQLTQGNSVNARNEYNDHTKRIQ
jgi:hypothetical protein